MTSVKEVMILHRLVFGILPDTLLKDVRNDFYEISKRADL